MNFPLQSLHIYRTRHPFDNSKVSESPAWLSFDHKASCRDFACNSRFWSLADWRSPCSYAGAPCENQFSRGGHLSVEPNHPCSARLSSESPSFHSFRRSFLAGRKESLICWQPKFNRTSTWSKSNLNMSIFNKPANGTVWRFSWAAITVVLTLGLFVAPTSGQVPSGATQSSMAQLPANFDKDQFARDLIGSLDTVCNDDNPKQDLAKLLDAHIKETLI